MTASGAMRTKNAAVKVQHIYAPCALMQVVHVLSDDGKFGNKLCQICDGFVRGVRRGLQDCHSPPFVPTPDQVAVFAKGTGRCQIFSIEPIPKTSECIPKCGDAAFCGDTSTRIHHNMLGLHKCVDNDSRKCVRSALGHVDLTLKSFELHSLYDVMRRINQNQHHQVAARSKKQPFDSVG